MSGLWRHQREAIDFAQRGEPTLLQMGMGTGKTRVAVEIAKSRGARRVLVIAPPRVIADAWGAQLGQWWPDAESLLLDRGGVATKATATRNALGLARARGGAAAPLWVVVNYESAWRDPLAALLLSTAWDLVILDEIHKIKSPSSKVGRFAAKLRRAVAPAGRLGLSGTPLPHSPLDAWGVFRFLEPSIFPSTFYAFRARFAVLGGFNGRIVLRYQNLEEFRRLFFRITYECGRDVLDLPEAVHVERTFRLPPSAARIYRELKDDFVAQLDSGLLTAEHALTRLLRLRQITSGFVGGESLAAPEQIHGEREAVLRDVFEEIDPAEPIVVFAVFREDLSAIWRAAQAAGRACFEVSGRRNELAEWKADQAGSVVAVQIQAGGEGIDLTRARYCVYYSVGYSLAQYEQSLARVHRPGQTRPVIYTHVIAEGTVDRRVYKALRDRRQVLDDILQRGLTDQQDERRAA